MLKQTYIAVLLVLLCQISVAHAQEAPVVTLTAEDLEQMQGYNFSGGLVLVQQARFHVGDNPAWADPAFDDSEWEVISPFFKQRSPYPIHPGWEGVGWFRIRLHIDASLEGIPLGFTLSHMGAIEMYLDGQRVYGQGTVGATPAEEIRGYDRTPFTLPVEAGRTHLLAVRYSQASVLGYWSRWYGDGFLVYWNERTELESHYRTMIFQRGLYPGFMFAFMLLFGLLATFYPTDPTFLRLTLFYGASLFLAYILFNVFALNDPAWYTPSLSTFPLFLVLSDLIMLLVLYRFFYEKTPKFYYVFVALGLGVYGTFLLLPYNNEIVRAFNVLVLIESLRVIGRMLYKRARWAWILGVGFGINILLRLWNQASARGWVDTLWSAGFHIGFFSVIFSSAALAAYVAARFAESQRAIVEANRTLEKKVEQRTADLQTSLETLKTTQAQLVQQEKLASLGELTAGIAHEIKNPLNFINNFAELMGELVDELGDELHADSGDSSAKKPHQLFEILADLKSNAEQIAKHGKRADGIVSAMMQHASGGTGRREPTDVNALLEEYVNLAYHGKRAQIGGFTCEIERDFDEAAGRIEMVPQDIGRVFLNLLSNAFDAVSGQDQSRVRVQTRRLNDAVEIRVTDNGPGIPKEYREKIFEPFFTTKPTGTGTGLGLSLSHDIVTQGHGGTLTLESNEGKGATFISTLPA